MTIVALHVVATIVDYYITKYAAKPMEQLQNLTTQYALGMRRLEEKEEREQAQRVQTGDVPQAACGESRENDFFNRVRFICSHKAAALDQS